MTEHLFKDYKYHHNSVDEGFRKLDLKYTEESYIHKKCTKAESIDRANANVEMEKRNL